MEGVKFVAVDFCRKRSGGKGQWGDWPMSGRKVSLEYHDRNCFACLGFEISSEATQGHSKVNRKAD